MEENLTDNIFLLRNLLLTNVLRSGVKLQDINSSYKRKLCLLDAKDAKKVKTVRDFCNKAKDYFDKQHINWDTDAFDMVDFHNVISKYADDIHPTVKRDSFISAVGHDAINTSITNILIEGSNYRTLAERQARSKILNSDYYLRAGLIPDIIQEFTKNTINHSIRNFFISLAAQLLVESKNSEQFKIILSLLGLTNKGFTNILDENPNQLYDYCIDLADSTIDFVKRSLKRDISYPTDDGFEYALELLSISSLALAIRGSMKSMVGKLFEKLILGTALSLFGFEYLKTAPEYDEDEYTKLCNAQRPYFWLSSTEQKGREKDATIMYKDRLIDIDIGLIGKGNPEVAADKLSRFKAEYDFENKSFIATTIILLANVNNGEIIKNSANKYKGKYVGITDNPTWLLQLNTDIFDFIDPNHELLNSFTTTDENQLKEQIKKTNFNKFL